MPSEELQSGIVLPRARDFTWRERLTLSITITCFLAAVTAGVVLAVIGGRLFASSGAENAPALVAPIAGMAGLFLLAYLAPLCLFILLVAASTCMMRCRYRLGYLIAMLCLVVSALAILKVPTLAFLLRAALAGLWLAGAALALASWVWLGEPRPRSPAA